MFVEIVLIPGDTNHFIGCVKTNVMTDDPGLLVQRLKKRNLDTIYLREYYIPFRMSRDRMEYLYGRIENNKSPDVNQDFKPIGNFYNLVVWTTYFNQQVKQLFLFLNRVGFSVIWVLAIVLIWLTIGFSIFYIIPILIMKIVLLVIAVLVSMYIISLPTLRT